MTEPATPPSTPASAPPRAPRPPWRRGARVASLALAAAAATAAVCGAGVACAWRSEGGTRWLLRHLPGVTAVDVQGSFGGGDLRVGSLRAIAGRTQVDIAALRVAGLALRWRPAAGQWLDVASAEWQAGAVRVTTLPGPAGAAPASAPGSLRSPLALSVDRLRIGTLTVGDAPPLRDVQAALALGAEGGKAHRVDRLSFAWERVRASGSLVVQADAPMRIEADVDAHDAPETSPGSSPETAKGPAPLPHWAASATARGTLAQLDVAIGLRGEALAGRAAPQAQASARVTPFARGPVSEVLLKTTELDLAALSARAPHTRLAGTLRVATTQPAALDVDLRNLAPAAWSDGGLPFSGLSAHLEMPWNGRSLAFPALRLVLADATGAGGELRAQGRWEGGRAQVQLDLDQVQPARLDARLGAWRVAGPLHAEFEGLPAPASLWDRESAPGAAAPAASSGWGAVVAHVTGRLAGTAPALGAAKNAVAPPMSLQLDALLRADALQLGAFDLRAGPATLTAQGAASRSAGGRWQGEAHARWTQLDPGAWWRLADAGPLRDGPNRLNGTLALQLADAPARWQGLAAIRGKAELTLADCTVAGLPLSGHAGLDALHAPWTLAADLRSAGNAAHAEGTLDPGGEHPDAPAVIERLRLTVDAPSLAMFAPRADGPPAAPAPAPAATPKTIPGELAARAATQVATGGRTDDTRALVPALAPSAAAPSRAAPGAWPAHGSARFEVELSGGLALGGPAARRPRGAPPLAIATHGELAGWNGPRAKLAKLRWDARASSDEQAPLAATVSLEDAQWGAARIAHADATLSGTLAEHRLQLQAEAPLSPPAWLAHFAAIGDANATRLDAQLQGRWNGDAVEAPAWQAHLAQFELRAVNESTAAKVADVAGAPASAATGGAAPAWLRLQPVDASLSRDAAGQWQTLRVGAGGASLAGLALSWQPSSWSAPAAPGVRAHWSLDAALAPFPVAPLLARAQPDLGWHGDLQMDARLHAAFDGAWHVDGRLARTAGDLSVSELAPDSNAALQALGLSGALLQVRAEGVHWQADANIAGMRVGELVGRWTAESPSPGELPQPGSPLQGRVQAHVADLNVWGAWLPPGWRLGGELRTDLALSGRWGAPQLTGRLTAQKLSVRNALEGVYAHDGDVAIVLAGDQARVERFVMQGGNGTLAVTGGARLGAAPDAKLQVQATQFQLLGRIDRRIVTSGTVDLDLGADAIKVAGRMGIDDGLIDISKGDAPALDGDVEVLGPARTAASDADAPGAADAAAAPKAGRSTGIDLAVDLGDKLQLRGRGIDTQLRGRLQVTSPNGVLQVRGTIRTDGGQYTAYGQKLDITRGELAFTGLVNDPRLDILTNRPNLDVTVGVAISGTALAPHVKLVSDPDMSDADKLSWLMLGRAPDGLGGADTALLQRAAIALLAGEDEAPTDQLLKRLGLTDFGVHQQTDTNDVRTTVVSLGRQVSQRVYVGYERGVNATSGNWQLIYRIAQRLTIRAQSGADNSADVIYTWRWN